MSDFEESQACYSCNIVPEDILICECQHHVCLKCASKNFQKFQEVTPNYICEYCQKITKIDNQTQAFIQSQQKVKNIKIDNMIKCGIHKSEKINYYCFDCIQECICAECVIHGHHQNHNVLNVKQAFEAIKEEIYKFINHQQKQIENIEIQIKQLDDHYQVIEKSNNIDFDNILKAFNSFRSIIENKQKLVIDQIQMLKTQNQQKIKEFKQSLINNKSQMKETLVNIQQKLQIKNHQDTITAINYYSSNNQNIKIQQNQQNQTYQQNQLKIKNIKSQINQQNEQLKTNLESLSYIQNQLQIQYFTIK